MAKTIYKYSLEPKDYQQIDMPVGAEILTIQVQNGTPCIWAWVDPNVAQMKPRAIALVGTGASVDFGREIKGVYIGSFQLYEGSLVFHAFE